MSVAKPLMALLLGLLVAAPAAEAYVTPIFYFLKDAPSPTDGAVPPLPIPPLIPIPVPTVTVDAGVLDPYSREAGNAPNSTTAHQREIVAGSDLLLPIQFVTPAGHEHPDRIKGPLFVGLWTGQSAAMNANLTATLYEIPVGGAPIALANASVVLDFNQSKLPTDPTVLIPENQTDPQAIAFYELAQLYPVLLQPPALFILGPIDVTFAPDSAFAIGFRLEQGSSPLPLPLSAKASIQYDAAAAPSFVYVPWYSPDPPRPTSTRAPPSYTYGQSRSTDANGMPVTDGVIVDDDSKDSPGLGALAGVAVLGLAAFAMRRKFR